MRAFHQSTQCNEVVRSHVCRLSWAGAATSIIFVATKRIFCRDKNVQISVCRDKYLSQRFFVAKNVFVATSILLSQQTSGCCDKLTNKRLVATKHLSRQNYVCRDKYSGEAKMILWLLPPMTVDYHCNCIYGRLGLFITYTHAVPPLSLIHI